MPAWSGLQKVTRAEHRADSRRRSCRCARGADGARSDGVTTRAERIAAAFRAACLDELEAPKPGNVHVFASGHRMTAAEFVRSAEVAAAPLAAPGARVGNRIRGAVEATLAAGRHQHQSRHHPALRTAGRSGRRQIWRPSFRRSRRCCASLDVRDAELAFRAIARAAPAGLGRAERHDVAEAATVTLKAAMAEASSRDRIARQYVSDFEDIFERGEPALAAALAALGRAAMGHACGLSRVSLRISRQPYRSQARHRDGGGRMPRRGAISCSECDPPKARPLSSPIS